MGAASSRRHARRPRACCRSAPGFRAIVLANRPGYPFLGNDFFRECGDVLSCHTVANPDLPSELQLLRQYGPDVPDAILTRVAAVFAELRARATPASSRTRTRRARRSRWCATCRPSRRRRPRRGRQRLRLRQPPAAAHAQLSGVLRRHGIPAARRLAAAVRRPPRADHRALPPAEPIESWTPSTGAAPARQHERRAAHAMARRATRARRPSCPPTSRRLVERAPPPATDGCLLDAGLHARLQRGGAPVAAAARRAPRLRARRPSAPTARRTCSRRATRACTSSASRPTRTRSRTRRSAAGCAHWPSASGAARAARGGVRRRPAPSPAAHWSDQGLRSRPTHDAADRRRRRRRAAEVAPPPRGAARNRARRVTASARPATALSGGWRRRRRQGVLARCRRRHWREAARTDRAAAPRGRPSSRRRYAAARRRIVAGRGRRRQFASVHGGTSRLLAPC